MLSRKFRFIRVGWYSAGIYSGSPTPRTTVHDGDYGTNGTAITSKYLGKAASDKFSEQFNSHFAIVDVVF